MNPNRSTSPVTDFIFNKASRRSIPFSGTFELSPVCNFACRMCYVRKTVKEVQAAPRLILKLEQWLKIAREARDAGMLYLLLTGGEPFLWPDFWELYEELVRMGLLVSINTNGSLINDVAVEKLRKLPPKRINVTLYGASDETYEALCGVKNVFTRVDHTISALKEAGVQVKLNCSLTPQNADDLDKIIAYAQEHGLILQISTYMFPPIRRDLDMVGKNDRFTPRESAFYRMKAYQLQNGDDAYYQYLKSILDGSVEPPGLDEGCVDPIDGKIRCRAGNASFWVTWDGWMTPCGMMTEPKVELAERTFGGAWKELVDNSRKLALSSICGSCPNVGLCHSCAAMALAETGKFSGMPKYLCKTVQAMQAIANEELKG